MGENVMMSDFVVCLEGLPPDATDEEELQAWAQAEFRRACPEFIVRPDLVTHMSPPLPDKRESFAPSQIEVYAVSICYDFADRWETVDDQVWKLMERMEVDILVIDILEHHIGLAT